VQTHHCPFIIALGITDTKYMNPYPSATKNIARKKKFV
jgi:hypothetical protein